MSKLSIYETGWMNLVFEGKNKEYGAYQLRQESPRTTAFAFLFGLLFIASISGLGMLLSSFGAKPPMTNEVPPLDTLVHVTNVKFPKEPKLPKITPPKSTTVETTTPKAVLRNPVISHPDVAVDVTPTNTPLSTPVENGAPTGTGTTPTPTGTGTATIPVPPVIDNGDTLGNETNVDVMPEYPGGIKKFLAYVGSNFEKPEIDETVVIIMSFVVEKDGSMSNIKVLRNPGYGLDKEAVRVLKSQRTKWKPGIKNGKPIRVLYSLPIRITKG